MRRSGRRWALTASATTAVVGVIALVAPSASSSPHADITLRPAPLTRATHVVDVRSPRGRALLPSPSSPLPGGAWQPLGPAPLGPATLGGGGFYGGINSGRVTSLAYIPSGPHAGRVVVGTAGGGIWTTDNNGSVWTARSDFAPSLAIGSVAVDPSHPDHLIAGTGEANQSGDSYPGYGILSSTNGGTTWSTQDPGGEFNGFKIAQVAIDPSNSSHMFAATTGGLYVTSNGGATWTKPTDPSYASIDGSISSVVINPVTPAIVFIGGGPAQVAESTDGGVHWAPANSGIAAPGGFPLTALAIANSAPSTMYASIGSLSPAGAYKSTNGGATWNALSTPDYTGGGYAYGGGGPGDQGWYDNVLAVDPTNANHVLFGGIAEIESTDGGTSWTNINGESFFGGGTNLIHPDQHAIAFGAGGKVWTGDDGGVYLYNPAGPSVANKNGNLNITQFYFGFNEVGGTVLAGSQDNSSGRTSSSNLGPWTEIWDGDGGPSFITPNHSSTQFIEADSALYRSNDAFASDLTNITPMGGVPSLFSPPIAVIPSSTTPTDPTVFYGGTDLWRTTNPSTASPTWTTVTSVGTSVSAIATSPSDPKVVYVGFTDGTVQVSTDGGLTFTSLATQPFTPETYVTGLSVNPSNPKAITLSVSNGDTRTYVSFPHVAQYAYTSSPGTGTWTDITGNLPAYAVSRVVYDQGALLAATDIGVYGAGSVAGGATSWSRVGTALPLVQAQDLFVDPSNRDVYVITHGRGAWRLHYATTISSVSPNAGPKQGGQKVTISGADFTGATKVTFGTAAGTHVKVVSSSTITVTTPAHAAGTVDVRVTALAGKSTVTPADHYTYESSPTVTSISPAKGAHGGGNIITLVGTNFVGATKVLFGSTPGTNVTVVSPTKLTVKAPAHAKGTVSVQVTTPSGTSPKSGKGVYQFT